LRENDTFGLAVYGPCFAYAKTPDDTSSCVRETSKNFFLHFSPKRESRLVLGVRMTTPTATDHTVKLPDLVGFDADQATQMLGELGLMPITRTVEANDISEVGFVVALNPPAGNPVRRSAFIAVSVAVHRKAQGRDKGSLGGRAGTLVRPRARTEVRDQLAIPPVESRRASVQRQEHCSQAGRDVS